MTTDSTTYHYRRCTACGCVFSWPPIDDDGEEIVGTGISCTACFSAKTEPTDERPAPSTEGGGT